MQENVEQPPASAWSAVGAVLAFPVVVGAVIPIALARESLRAGDVFWPGLGVVLVGIAIVTSTVRAFFSQGKGTLAPWNPPRKLVTSGLFARCRNPMYIGVVTTVLGWAALACSQSVATYGVLLWLGFHLRVVIAEEPWAARTFPDDWPRYREHVPRWLPRLLS